MKRTLIALAASLALTIPALAHHDGEIVEQNSVRVSHAHTAEPAAMANGIHVYFNTENLGEEPDRIVGASVSFAKPGRFEANVLGSDGTLAVETVSAVAIQPGQTLSLEPGSIRLVFDDVKATLKAGEHFDMTLVFERAGPITVEVEIEDGADLDETPGS